jgi:hypothetical protein
MLARPSLGLSKTVTSLSVILGCKIRKVFHLRGIVHAVCDDSKGLRLLIVQGTVVDDMLERDI